MSGSPLRFVSVLAVVLPVALAAWLPAQEKTSELETLRREIAAMKERLTARDHEIARLRVQLGGGKRRAAPRSVKAAKPAARNGVSKAVKKALALRAKGGKNAAVLAAKKEEEALAEVQRQVLLRRLAVQRAPVVARQMVFLNGLGFAHPLKPVNSLMRGEYQKALARLAAERAKLDKIQDPTAARKVVDEMNRLLLDVRRALWEQEQARKKKGPAKKDTVKK